MHEDSKPPPRPIGLSFAEDFDDHGTPAPKGWGKVVRDSDLIEEYGLPRKGERSAKT